MSFVFFTHRPPFSLFALSSYNFIPALTSKHWFQVDHRLMLQAYTGMTVYLAVHFVLTELPLLRFLPEVRADKTGRTASRLSLTGLSLAKLCSRSVLAFHVLPVLLPLVASPSVLSPPSPLSVYLLFFFVSESFLHASKAAYSTFLSADSFSVPGWLLFLRFDAPLVLGPLQALHALLLTTFAFFTPPSCALFDPESWRSLPVSLSSSTSSCRPSSDVVPSLALLSSPLFPALVFLLVTLLLDAPPFFWASSKLARQEHEEGYRNWDAIEPERMDELHEFRRLADPALKREEKRSKQQRTKRAAVASGSGDEKRKEK